jgi:hypothetical protein
MKGNDSLVNTEMDFRCGGGDQISRSISPSISSLKDFEEYLCLSFGLVDLTSSHVACETRQSEQRIYRSGRSIERPNYSQNFQSSTAGPSTPTNTRHRKNMLGEDIAVASSLRGKGRPFFIEAQKGSTHEEAEDDGMEFVFLPDDSPLKGKEKAIRRKREPDLGISYSIPDYITPRDKSMENGGKSSDLLSRTQHRCPPATKVRLHPKQLGVDCTQDIVLVVSRVKRKENDKRK